MGDRKKIGVAGPIEIDLLQDYIYEHHHPIINRIKGLGGSQVTQLVREFLKRGHHVSVFTLDRQVGAKEQVLIEGPLLKIYVGPWRRGKLVTIDFQSVERKALINFIIDAKPDVIHAHWTYEFAQAAICSGLPRVITVRDWAPKILSLIPSMYRVMRLIMNHKTLKSSSLFTANSPYIAQKLKKYYDIDAQVVPNGIEDGLFSTKENHFNQTSPVIITINSDFGKLKNTKKLILAFADIHKRVAYSPVLKMIGNGFEYRGVAHQWAKKQGLTHGIEFVGPLPRTEVIKALGEADLMVHPALEESFGNTLVEAMANKVPVIAGIQSGAVPWVLGKGKAGKLVDITSEKAMSDAMVDVLRLTTRWAYYSAEGYKRASEVFRISQIASQYEDIFAKITEKK